MKTFLTTPGYRRSLALRRVTAAALVIAALCFSTLHLAQQESPVVIYSTTVAAGSRLTEADVRIARMPHSMIPENSVTNPEEIVGNVTVVSRPNGSIATRHDFVETTLISTKVTNDTEAFGNEDSNIIPIKLAEPTLAGLLRPGDVISILTTESDKSEPVMIAAGGRVVFAVTEASELPGATPGTVLVSLPATAAQHVAAASLSLPLAVVVTGDRSHE